MRLICRVVWRSVWASRGRRWVRRGLVGKGGDVCEGLFLDFASYKPVEVRHIDTASSR